MGHVIDLLPTEDSVLAIEKQKKKKKKKKKKSHYSTIIIIIIDRFYIALFSALEQTHCARM